MIAEQVVETPKVLVRSTVALPELPGNEHELEGRTEQTGQFVSLIPMLEDFSPAE